MMKNAGADRQADITRYTTDLGASNQLQAALARQEMDADLLKEALAKGPDWMKEGADLQHIPLVARLFTGGQIDQQTAQGAVVNILKKQAEIRHLNAQAAAAGQAGAPSFEIRQDFDPHGVAGGYTTISKGRGGFSGQVDTTAQAQLRRGQYSQPGGPLYGGPKALGGASPSGSRTMPLYQSTP
jgi:hypothetical protein